MVYVSAEVSPFAKSGEQADVASSLPGYLVSLGLDVSVVMPMIRTPYMESLSRDLVIPELLVPTTEGEHVKCRVFKADLNGFPLFIIDNPKYFWRENVYGTGRGEYLDNDERYIVFGRAVLEFLRIRNRPIDIIHCNNWPTAMIPVFLKTHYGGNRFFRGVRTLLTLHNIAYQGVFPSDTLSMTGLKWTHLSKQQLLKNGKLNFLKTGILYSDILNTVSRSYRREILTARRGFGLSEILKSRRDRLFSIRNGIDYQVWNPENDAYLISRYKGPDFKGKSECKEDLLKEFDLDVRLERPLIGILSYFSLYKGFDLLIEGLEELMSMDIALVILGQGDEKYSSKLAGKAKKYPRRLAVSSEGSPALSHKLAAGADMFLIPSKYEPCGLSLLYGFRYATVPIARATGGLAERVKPFDWTTLKGNGFLFKDYSVPAMTAAVEEALKCYGRHDLWKRIMLSGFQEKHSWRRSAKRYANIYRKAMQIQ